VDDSDAPSVVHRYHVHVSRLDDDAVVLDARPYRDRHQIVAFLTRRHGTVRAVLREARAGKAPSAAATQILSHVRVVAHQGPSAELATCQRIDLRRSSFPLASDLARSAAAAVVAEQLATFVPPGDHDDRPYRLGVALLEALLDGVEPDLVVGYAQVWCLRLAGLLGWMDGDEPTGSAPPPAGTELFIAACSRLPPGGLPGAAPDDVAGWLDRRVRHEAERRLPALDFYRSNARSMP